MAVLALVPIVLSQLRALSRRKPDPAHDPVD
jgi:hypothetical protein